MSAYAEWRYDEYRQVGKDYGQPEEAEAYDKSHAQFRDVDAENRQLLELLELSSSARIADFGCGTGAFAVRAADQCESVVAVDVSEAMLRQARERSEAAGTSNIEFQRSGYLDFAADEESLDAATSSFSLHHLPDFWKSQALVRINRALKPGGLFFLRDVVYRDSGEISLVNGFVEKQAELGGEFLREDALGHFREEFSTYDWIMKGLLEKGGFEVESQNWEHPVVATYLCRRL
ncbi:class I SAM-dependent methyltransferase [Pelagicoccus mobilis]|uniref:Class I SAM-dependent methyltransferase n=1 Tax=Pelagicoccus mobilis TaxID=415221 RepID=A0A934RWD9_9BACT|nr:class I SAM-dependent methyltransferase [Pelagicoccus mobilis]MBK1876419.1 class I SAM-dependent methyltransferase [Pelagicoccus mobilis]